jgi:RHS repeat-associated protein
VSSTTNAGTSNQYTYDAHGNQTSDNGTALTWDAADRVASATPSGGTVTSYSYDALDRVVSHTAGGTTVRYAFSGFSDNPVAVLNSAGSVLQQLVVLPGGVLATVQSSGTVWSYPDLHGNVTVTTNNAGSRVNGPVAYDPWGQPVSGSQTPVNATGGNVLGAFGTNSKLTDSATGITILGARAYEAAEGRFLSVDPIEGGCANNYVYVFGDPFSKNDLSGRNWCPNITITHPGRGGGVSEPMGIFGGGVLGGWLGKATKLWVTWGAKWKAPSVMGNGVFGGVSVAWYDYATTGKINLCAIALGAAIGALMSALL